MRARDFSILVVDDDANDRALIVCALRHNGVTQPIYSVGSGREAIAYLKGEGNYSDRSRFKYPSFISTDLNMRDGDGFSVLEHLKNNPERTFIPTVVLTSSEDPYDIRKAYSLGASSYLVKPDSQPELQRLLQALFDFWMVCEIPTVDPYSKGVEGNSNGRIAERFYQTESR